jgi:protease-4
MSCFRQSSPPASALFGISLAALAIILAENPAPAQTNRSGIVIEDARTTQPRTQANRRRQATPAPTPTEIVLGGRRATTTPTLARSSETHTTPSTQQNQSSLIDRLLAAGDNVITPSGNRSNNAATTQTQALILSLRGSLPERDQVVLFGAPTRSLASVMTMLRRVRDDREIGTLVLRIAGVRVGLAEAEELRSLLQEIRQRDKRVIALLEDESQISYLIANAASEIILPPSGGIALTGLRADGYFLRGLLEKLGIKAEFIHQGEYKALGEIFERDSYSPPARRNMEEMIDTYYREVISIIAQGRNKTAAEIETIIDQGPATTSQALERGLIDRIAYADEVLEELRRTTSRLVTEDEYARRGRSNAADEIGNPLSLLLGMGRPGSTPRQDPELARLPQVALVYANGSISQGGSEEGFEETDAILNDDLIRTLDQIRRDRRIRAVLLRVNSPGGSAFASDLIWRKIRELDTEKPVVASMGGVAASGGYYIAMAARKVYATTGTLTGSIGVVGGKFSLAGTYEKLGITKESIGRGAFSDLFSESRLFSPTERQLIDEQMRVVYEDFLSKAATSRNMTRDQVHELAQGRVWTGADAKSAGLIDGTSGMNGAIDEIKRQLNLRTEDRIALVPFPRERTLLDLLTRAFSSSGGSGAKLGLSQPELQLLLQHAPNALRQNIFLALRLPELLRNERVLLLAPHAIHIH